MAPMEILKKFIFRFNVRIASSYALRFSWPQKKGKEYSDLIWSKENPSESPPKNKPYTSLQKLDTFAEFHEKLVECIWLRENVLQFLPLPIFFVILRYEIILHCFIRCGILLPGRCNTVQIFNEGSYTFFFLLNLVTFHEFIEGKFVDFRL